MGTSAAQKALDTLREEYWKLDARSRKLGVVVQSTPGSICATANHLYCEPVEKKRRMFDLVCTHCFHRLDAETHRSSGTYHASCIGFGFKPVEVLFGTTKKRRG